MNISQHDDDDLSSSQDADWISNRELIIILVISILLGIGALTGFAWGIYYMISYI